MPRVCSSWPREPGATPRLRGDGRRPVRNAHGTHFRAKRGDRSGPPAWEHGPQEPASGGGNAAGLPPSRSHGVLCGSERPRALRPRGSRLLAPPPCRGQRERGPRGPPRPRSAAWTDRTALPPRVQAALRPGPRQHAAPAAPAAGARDPGSPRGGAETGARAELTERPEVAFPQRGGAGRRRENYEKETCRITWRTCC